MSEQAAEAIISALETAGVPVDTEPMENMRGGGWFFDMSHAGSTFTVVVTEVGA